MRYAGTAVLMIFIAAGAYLIGYKTAYDRMERAAVNYETETFYAAITDITDSSITVQGMEINDINFRGRFTFPVMEETSYLWRGTRISAKDLEEGDNISITFYISQYVILFIQNKNRCTALFYEITST